MYVRAVLVVQRDSLFLSDVICSLRTAGISTYVSDARYDDIVNMAVLVSAEVLIIDQGIVSPDEFAWIVSAVISDSVIKHVVIVSNSSTCNIGMNSDKVTCIVPPVDISEIFSILGVDNEQRSVREKMEYKLARDIESVLISIGFSRRMPGFSSLREAVFCLMQDSSGRINLSRDIYPAAAGRLDMSPAAVERAIRVAVADMWENDPVMISRQLMLLPDIQPTNKKFLSAVAALVRKTSEKEAQLAGAGIL